MQTDVGDEIPKEPQLWFARETGSILPKNSSSWIPRLRVLLVSSCATPREMGVRPVILRTNANGGWEAQPPIPRNAQMTNVVTGACCPSLRT